MITDADRTTDADVVVIGSGPAGLTAAAYLAAAGRRVIVLEQHDLAGGNCTVFRHRGYEFDVGLHYIGDCGEGGLIPSVLAAVGLEDRITYAPMDQDGFDTLVYPDVEVRVPADWDTYRQRLTLVVPDDAAGVTRCVTVLREVAEQTRNANIPGVETPTLDEWGMRTLDELFVKCELSPRARSLLDHWGGLYGSAPDAATVSMHAAIIDHYMRGAFYPVGGGQVIPARLVEVVESLGGEVRTLACVDEIMVDDGQVSGVRLAGGETITAPVVVSNADYKRTVRELVGAEHWRADTVETADEMLMTLALVVLYVVVDIDLTTGQPNTNYHVFPDWDTEGVYAALEAGQMPDGEMWTYISMASRKDPANTELCPPGHTNFQIMTLAPRGYGFWGVEDGPTHGPSYRRDEQYRAAKKRLTDALLTSAERALGPFRDHIVHIEMATPLTHERYTRSSEGTSYGLQHSPAQSGRNRPRFRTEIPGLYLTGANTVAGHGIAGTILGGAQCASTIADRPMFIEAMMGERFVDPSILPHDGPDWDPMEVSRGAALRTVRAAGRDARAAASGD